jgi:hypothetical protein
MKNFIKILSIIALAAAIGFSITACGDGAGGGGGGSGSLNSALNGTWDNPAEGEKLVLNNGSFTVSQNNVEIIKGTYSVSGSNVTMAVTQVYGSVLGEDAEDVGLSVSKWYTRQQLKADVIKYFVSEGMTSAQAETAYNENLRELESELFGTYNGTYSGNTLTVNGSAYTKGGTTTGSNANVVGTWKGTYTEKESGLNMTVNLTWVFKADGTWSGSTETMGITMDAVGTYTVSGNTVRVTNTTHGATDTATISGNTMTASVRSGTNGPIIDTITLRKN